MTAEIVELKPKSKCLIQSYFHCVKCLEEMPDDMTPKNYQRIQAGWTVEGFQVWCVRHDLQIIHVDFEGQQHKAI